MNSENHETPDVLLVEDNKTNQFLVMGILNRLGCPCRTAVNGEEAVAAFRSKRPKLVLMDVQMPVMDGLEATRAIRSLESELGGRTPIIAITARALQGDEKDCFEAGMDDYIRKPIRLESLSVKLLQWLKEAA